MNKENIMRNIEIEKVVLNCGATDDKLERSEKLLKLLTGRKIKKSSSTKRIPSFGVRPGLKTGCMVTIRGNEKEKLLKRLLGSIGNQIRKKQIVENQFSFGIKEYLEIPDMEYQRDIGMLGLDVCVVFKRKGKRVGLKKIKRGKVPSSQNVTKEEIFMYVQDKLGIEVK